MAKPKRQKSGVVKVQAIPLSAVLTFIVFILPRNNVTIISVASVASLIVIWLIWRYLQRSRLVKGIATTVFLVSIAWGTYHSLDFKAKPLQAEVYADYQCYEK